MHISSTQMYSKSMSLGTPFTAGNSAIVTRIQRLFCLRPPTIGDEVGSRLESAGSYLYHEPPKPTFLEVFMVNNLVFRWPKPLFFMVLGAHGSSTHLQLGLSKKYSACTVPLFQHRGGSSWIRSITRT